MILKNQKGETLAETVVSMAILATLLATVFIILSFSTRVSREALDTIRNTNGELVSIYDNVDANADGKIDALSGAVPFDTSIKLSFSIEAEKRPTTGTVEKELFAFHEYTISDAVNTYRTDSGLFLFR